MNYYKGFAKWGNWAKDLCQRSVLHCNFNACSSFEEELKSLVLNKKNFIFLLYLFHHFCAVFLKFKNEFLHVNFLFLLMLHNFLLYRCCDLLRLSQNIRSDFYIFFVLSIPKANKNSPLNKLKPNFPNLFRISILKKPFDCSKLMFPKGKIIAAYSKKILPISSKSIWGFTSI